MKQFRNKRLASMIHEEVSLLLLNGLKDPRISQWTTITKVEVPKDLRSAKIFFSVRGSDKEKQKTLDGLQSARGFIKNHLSKFVKTKFMPELFFKLDDSIEYAQYMIEKINTVLGNEEPQTVLHEASQDTQTVEHDNKQE